MTHRQFVTWEAWMRYDWSAPTWVTKHLQMVGAEVRRSYSKYPNSVKMEDMAVVVVGQQPDELVDPDEFFLDGMMARNIVPTKHVVLDNEGNVLSEKVIDGRTGISQVSRAIARRELELREDVSGCEAGS